MTGWPVFWSVTVYPHWRSSLMMRWARTGIWMCASARRWPESSNLMHQTPGTILATEIMVIESLSADRVAEPGETEPHPQPVCADVEAAQRPACNLPASVGLDSERSPWRRGRGTAGASVRDSRALRVRGTGIVGHELRVGRSAAVRAGLTGFTLMDL